MMTTPSVAVRMSDPRSEVKSIARTESLVITNGRSKLTLPDVAVYRLWRHAPAGTTRNHLDPRYIEAAGAFLAGTAIARPKAGERNYFPMESVGADCEV
jgi:hypothetical protein